MNHREMIEVMDQAIASHNCIRAFVARMAEFCVGRLRDSGVSSTVLSKLKKELAGWNMHTNSWSDK